MPLLADSLLPPNEAVTLAAWLGCFLFFVAGINGVWKLVQRLKDKPPPAEILERVQAKFATRSMVDGVQAEVRVVESKLENFRSEVRLMAERHSEMARVALEQQTKSIESKVEGSRIERKEEITELHDKINSVAILAGKVETSFELTNQRLSGIEGKIDRAIERAANPHRPR